MIIGWNTLVAQREFKMMNAKIYNSNKYKDFKGSPYLWKKNKEVIVYDYRANEFNSVMGNYNGLNNEFEVYQRDKYILLPQSIYVKIKVINDPEFQYSLFSNVHPKLKDKYCIQYERTSNYSVYESFIPQTSVVSLDSPGKPTKFNKIIRKTRYYIVYGGELIKFNIKKKKLIKQFGHKKEINKFLKQKKIKIKKIEDVLPLFEFLDANGWLRSNSDIE